MRLWTNKLTNTSMKNKTHTHTHAHINRIHTPSHRNTRACTHTDAQTHAHINEDTHRCTQWTMIRARCCFPPTLGINFSFPPSVIFSSTLTSLDSPPLVSLWFWTFCKKGQQLFRENPNQQTFVWNDKGRTKTCHDKGAKNKNQGALGVIVYCESTFFTFNLINNTRFPNVWWVSTLCL